jgi:undecaprenyl diphosphate synthase
MEGHRKGALVVENLLDTALELKIKYISLYAFSTENWVRPAIEVKSLWNLLEEFFDKKLPLMKKKGIRIIHSGRMGKIPRHTQNVIKSAIKQTAGNKKVFLNFCLNYGARQEIIDAVNEWRIHKEFDKKLTIRKLEKYFYSKLPDVDLLIRTSGECRISNFLLWQSAYAEFVFLKVLWPDFKSVHLYRAILEYQKRSRRFGGV